MLTWIEKTRKKPKTVRNRYAFVGASAVTLVIVLFWIVSLPAKLDRIAAENSDDVVIEGESSVLLDLFGRAADNIAAVFGVSDTTTPEDDLVDTAAKPEERRAIEVPTLSPENALNVRSKQFELNRVPPRVVLIGTTSVSAATGTTSAE